MYYSKFFILLSALLISNSTQIANAQAKNEICFSTEAEYKEILASNKAPLILQKLPLYLGGESMIKGKVAVSLSFVNGVIKFYVNAATMIGDFKITTSNENRVKVCVDDAKLKLEFTKGPAQEATLLGPKKISIKGFDIETMNLKDFTSLDAAVSERASASAKTKSNSSSAGGNQ